MIYVIAIMPSLGTADKIFAPAGVTKTPAEYLLASSCSILSPLKITIAMIAIIPTNNRLKEKMNDFFARAIKAAVSGDIA